jgi:hypothetical protein
MHGQIQQSFGIAELVNELQARIQADQALLMQVMSYWATERPEQPLNDLDALTPIDVVEPKTKGKLTTGQVKWIARNREENGTSEAFVKVGRRLYVNVPLLIQLISAHQGRGK